MNSRRLLVSSAFLDKTFELPVKDATKKPKRCLQTCACVRECARVCVNKVNLARVRACVPACMRACVRAGDALAPLL